MNPRIKRSLAPIAVIIAGIGVYQLLAELKPQPEKSTEARRAISVSVEAATISTVYTSVTSQGEVRAKTHVDIIAEVAGRVIEVSSEFIEGGRVRPNTPLVSIEQTDYTAAVMTAKARLATAKVIMMQADADADVARYQLRNESKPSDLALKKPQVAEAQANLGAAEADLTRARLNLARTHIGLPFSGRVTDTSVALGQYVSPGSLIGRAFADDMVELRLPLNESQMAILDLPVGFTAAVDNGPTIDISATLAGRKHQWFGRLKRLDAAIDPSTRMLFATAQVQDPYGKGAAMTGMPLAVGLFVSVKITGPTLENVLVISPSALRAGNLVYVLNQDQKLEIKTVDVSYSDAKKVVVSSGLATGDMVIQSSIRNAVEGMPLEIISPDQPPTPEGNSTMSSED